MFMVCLVMNFVSLAKYFLLLICLQKMRWDLC